MKFRALMWKHMKARYRYYFRTIIEILFPIIIFCFAYVVKELVFNAQDKSALDFEMVQKNSNNMEFPHQVLYYPPTIVTDRIMDLVGETLFLKRLTTFPGYHESGFYGAPNVSDLQHYSNEMSARTAIVLFWNMADYVSYTFPANLNYTIKIKNKLKLHVRPTDGKIVPQTNSDPLNELFVSLQWAIDKSYLTLQHGLDKYTDISFLALPKTEKKMLKVQILLIMHVFSYLSLGVIFMFHVARVVEERLSGAQALINMAGVSSLLFNLAHLANALIFGLVYTGGVVVFLVISINKPILQASNLVLVALMIFLYYCNVILMGFLVCYVLSDRRHVMSAAAGFYGLSYLPCLFLYKVQFTKKYLLILAGFLPHVPMNWFWTHLAYLENDGSGLNTATILKENEGLIVAPVYAYVMLFVQFVVFTLTAYYFALVKPGKFASALPWDFLCDKGYWLGAKSFYEEELLADVHGPSDKYKNYFESRPPQRHIGIRIVNVTKIYTNTVALQKITLNIARGEITVLLGHNGAGKTTLLNIIAGMEKPTTGTVFVNGLDVTKHSGRVRKYVGVCPQHNILLSELTVIEHIMFFIMIRKNIDFKLARYKSNLLLKRLQLDSYANMRIPNISPGHKRRLQLGCALAGDTNVLILDEPTSGLEVAIRRGLWNLLISLRGDRTVLLTTHFMEEADALGDRVAALHVGRLRCYASPWFLKKAVGKGYRLTLMTIGPPNVNLITEMVQSEVPEAFIKEATVNCVTMNLPKETRASFPKLLAVLEEHRAALNLLSIGIGTITLDEVFLRLCSDVHVSFRMDDSELHSHLTNTTVTGLALYVKQLLALTQRQLQYYMSHKYSFLFLEFIVPVVMLAFLTYATNAQKSHGPAKTLSVLPLSSFDGLPHKKVFLHLPGERQLRSLPPKLEERFEGVVFELVPNVTRAALELNNQHSSTLEKFLFGIDLDDTQAKVVYSQVPNSAAIAVNMIANLLAERSRAPSEQNAITAYSATITSVDAKKTDFLKKARVKSHADVFNWALFVSLVIIATVIHSVMPLSRERVTGTRHIFMMYGCSPILYWIFTLFYHTLFYIILLVVPALLTTMIFEGDRTLDQVEFRVALLVTLIIGLMAYLTIMYLVSLIAKEVNVIIVSTIFVLVFGMITPTCQALLLENTSNSGFFYYLVQIIDYTLPPHTFTTNLLKAGRVARMNALCKIVKKFCPNVNETTVDDVNFNVDYCCTITLGINVAQDVPSGIAVIHSPVESKSTLMQCYFCMQREGLAPRFITGAVQSAIYMILVVLTQMGIFSALWDRLQNRGFKPITTTSLDPLLLKEFTHVNNSIRLKRETTNDVALIQNVYKRYPHCKHSKVAVAGITFSVKQGECIGVVGVTGAGKTSLAKMIVAAEPITRGKIICKGVRARFKDREYLRTLGYCSQGNMLDDFRTAEQNLATLLKLRGCKKQDVKNGVENWIQFVALEKHSGKRVSLFSGGCRRRLAVAAALMSDGALTVLDEPTAGIDVAARREVWRALGEGLRGDRSAIVTSNIMEEMEALCSRVLVLVEGAAAALASPAQLRASHDKGHSLVLTLSTDEDLATPKNLQNLDSYVREVFTCRLVDGHKSMLEYRIDPSISYSELFASVEQIKDKYKELILDYTIKEPTLEEVFCTFNKNSHRNLNLKDFLAN